MTSPDAGAFRIIDANLNRIGEGLRVLEDCARLLLNDGGLTRELKSLRHELLQADLSLNKELLQARDSTADVGMDIEAPGQDKPKEIPLLAVANSRRVQESLRVIEELAKLPGVGLDSGRFRHARFKLYTLERVLLSRLLREDKAKRLSGLYAVIDFSRTGGQVTEIARRAAGAGACAIEFKCPSGEALAPAEEVKRACSESGVFFIVCDRLEIALATKADGLRLEGEGLPVSVARRLLPMDSLLGVSVRTSDDAICARNEGADFVVFSLEGGISALRHIRQAAVPVVAVDFSGAIRDNIAEIRAAGADAIALDFSRLEMEAFQVAACFAESERTDG